MKPDRIALLLLVALCAGCGTDAQFEDLRTQMDEIAKRPKGNIEPPPEFKPYTTFTYGSSSLRSPFSPPVAVDLSLLSTKKSSVKPDFDRPKEALEEFSIDSLVMVGTLSRPGNALFALMRDANGGLHRVATGNYIGRNHGRIQVVTPQKVDVVEIVTDGQDGWIERPRTIALHEQE